MSEKQRRQPVIRFMCLYIAFLLPNAVNGDRRPNDGRLAMIEVIPRQDTVSPPSGQGQAIQREINDSPAFDKSRLLHGIYAKAGSMQGAMGALIDFRSCEKDDEEFLKRKTGEDWVAVMRYLPAEQSDNSTAIGSECPFILDRVSVFGDDVVLSPNALCCKAELMNGRIMRLSLAMKLHTNGTEVKKAMLFGASAIIILTMNPNILQELDVVLLLKKPVVLVDDLDNITALLGVLKWVLKFKVKVTHCPSLYDTQTFTIWSACWRARPGSGVVCMSDSRLSKMNVNFFWSYFFSAMAVIMMLLLITCRGLLYDREDDWDNQSIRAAAWQQLSCLKIKRYRKALCKHDDSERDTCAICLDHFYQRQKIRILPCVHEFHTKCIDPWLVRRPFCPLCKTNVLELNRFGSIFQNSGL